MSPLNVLVACEESQTVCLAFRQLGHRAFSCDLQDSSGGHPEWHIKGDCLPFLNGDCEFVTCDGKAHRQQGEWDLLIAPPPCTYMSKAGARWMYAGGVLNEERLRLALDGKAFFMQMLNAKCLYIAIENPVPMKIVELPSPTCYVQPFEFGSPYSKKTCLWLKNLPPLMPTAIMQKHEPYLPSNFSGRKKGQKWSRGIVHNAKDASKTFSGIADAMANQWTAFMEDEGKRNKKQHIQMAKDTIYTTGVVTESLGNDRFKVELDNGAEITAYPCGRIRLHHIRILVGDKVRVELSPYDLSNGRIARRL